MVQKSFSGSWVVRNRPIYSTFSCCESLGQRRKNCSWLSLTLLPSCFPAAEASWMWGSYWGESLEQVLSQAAPVFPLCPVRERGFFSSCLSLKEAFSKSLQRADLWKCWALERSLLLISLPPCRVALFSSLRISWITNFSSPTGRGCRRPNSKFWSSVLVLGQC